MSRTKKGKKPPGAEYWGKRPIARNHGANPGPETKKLTHRMERIEGKNQIKRELKDESDAE